MARHHPLLLQPSCSSWPCTTTLTPAPTRGRSRACTLLQIYDGGVKVCLTALRLAPRKRGRSQSEMGWLGKSIRGPSGRRRRRSERKCAHVPVCVLHRWRVWCAGLKGSGGDGEARWGPAEHISFHAERSRGRADSCAQPSL